LLSVSGSNSRENYKSEKIKEGKPERKKEKRNWKIRK
jgi:hypothetical protein